MDPITATCTMITTILQVWMKIWDATPDADKAKLAANIAQFNVAAGTFFLQVQSKIVAK